MASEKKQILDIYHKRIDDFNASQVDLSKKIRIISFIRLMVFIIGSGLVIYYANVNPNGIIYTLAISIIAFLFLVKQHDKLIKKKNHFKLLANINKEEIAYHEGRWTSFDAGNEFLKKPSLHAKDLDIFGQDSLFQKINRTSTLAGKNRLAHWFRYPKQRIEDILERQAGVEEIKSDLDFRQEFRAIGLSSEDTRGDYSRMIRWMKEKPWISNKKSFKYALYAIPAINISLTVIASFGIIPWSFCGASIILTLVYLAPLQKKINKSYLLLSKRASILVKYVELLKTVENKEFKSNVLNILQKEMTEDGVKAWQHIDDLTKILQKLDQRLNMLVGVLLNIYLLWDIRMLKQVEVWKQDNMDDLIIWFNNIGIFDAYCSIANLAYNEPNWIFPEPKSDQLLNAKELRHPMMNFEDCIPNDIQINSRPFFQVVTGANMAGKSTWLRTVGSNLLLAMMGSVVNAKEYSFSPVNIATSLHTTDSLMKNESYFYSELKRLREIINWLHDGKPVFVLLDEILKGTNSGDKETGSIALLKQLIDLKAFGIIATHDLNLAKIADKYKEYTDNRRFEADIIDDKLYFDYLIKEGIAQNFNATFLMKKMGITV